MRKAALPLALAFILFAAVPVMADGLYLGFKVGGGVVHSDTSLSTNGAHGVGPIWAGIPFPVSETIGLGSNNEMGFLAGLNIGYDFKRAFDAPVRL
jgi:hypothetical protein